MKNVEWTARVSLARIRLAQIVTQQEVALLCT